MWFFSLYKTMPSFEKKISCALFLQFKIQNKLNIVTAGTEAWFAFKWRETQSSPKLCSTTITAWLAKGLLGVIFIIKPHQ